MSGDGDDPCHVGTRAVATSTSERASSVSKKSEFEHLILLMALDRLQRMNGEPVLFSYADFEWFCERYGVLAEHPTLPRLVVESDDDMTMRVSVTRSSEDAFADLVRSLGLNVIVVDESSFL